MPQIDIRAAKKQLSELVDRAAAGEEILIAKAGVPLARLVALDSETARPKRVLGSLAGRLVIPPDFDAPLPDEVLDAFEGK